MALWDSFGRLANIGASVASAGASIYQAHAASQAAERQASLAQKQAQEKVTQRRRRQKQLTGQIRAQAGAAGIDLSGSSTSLLIDEEDRFADEDIDAILSFGDTQADIYRNQGFAAKVGGGFSASGSLLGGAFNDYRYFGG